MCVFGDSCGNRGVNEKIVTCVVVEGVGFFLKIADCEIQLAVVVKVSKSDPHSCLCLSHIAAANAGE